MRIRSFIIAYALILAILLFADRRPGSAKQARYSHVVDLTEGPRTSKSLNTASDSKTRIIAPSSLIPGTWAAGQIPPERLIAPLVVMDLNSPSEAGSQISLDDIALWESRYGMIPQGALVAVRRANNPASLALTGPTASFPVARDAAQFLIDARYTIGFAVETQVDLASDRSLARQLALHGNYVVETATQFAALPATGSLIIVAPEKNIKRGEAPVRILAMVR
jgi:kynurenine formamidase